MAERIEEPEIEAEEALEQGSPAAAAVALAFMRKLRGGKGDPKLDDFLDKQTRLIDLQTEHLHEQRELQLAHLKVRRWKDRLSLALQVLGVAIGAAVVITLGVMAWQAHEDHGLVIEAFSVPPDLAQRGLTGQVIASQLLDKLSAMQARTDSARPARSYQNNWGDDLKVEIPETGVSLGELNRWMRQWLGSQTRISGEVFRTASGLTLSVRTGEDGGASVSGPEGDVDKLLQQAAETIYQRSQPYRYALWIIEQGRSDEGYKAMTALADGPAGEDRSWADGIASVMIDRGDIQGGVARIDDARRLFADKPHDWMMIASAYYALDREEAMLEASRRGDGLLRRNPGDVTPIARTAESLTLEVFSTEALGDFQTASALNARVATLPDYQGSVLNALEDEIFDDGAVHDPAAADAVFVQARSANALKSDLALNALEADVALERWPQALQDSLALQAPQGPASQIGPTLGLSTQTRRLGAAWTAYAKVMSGDVAGAKALIATTPLDCDTCVRMRGRIAAIEHDWPTAERWFAMATRQAPSVPFAYADWGRMLLAKGDVDGAIAKLALAHQKGPHYADALELWGEALMKKGDYAGAVAKFAEAAKDAPRWALNQQLWRQAQAKAHDHG